MLCDYTVFAFHSVDVMCCGYFFYLLNFYGLCVRVCDMVFMRRSEVNLGESFLPPLRGLWRLNLGPQACQANAVPLSLRPSPVFCCSSCFVFVCLFLRRRSQSVFRLAWSYAVQDGLKLMVVLLPQLPECWDYRSELFSQLIYCVY